MKIVLSACLVSIILILFSCETKTIHLNNSLLNLPVAEIKPESLVIHSSIRMDNYYWLRERENPKVIE